MSSGLGDAVEGTLMFITSKPTNSPSPYLCIRMSMAIMPKGFAVVLLRRVHLVSQLYSRARSRSKTKEEAASIEPAQS